MAHEIIMPKLGLTMTTGTVVEWLKKEGDQVAQGDVLLEITTDKITNTVEAPQDGILLKIYIKEGEEVPCFTVLGMLGEAGEQVAESKKAEPAPAPDHETAQPTPDSPTPASPASVSAIPKKVKITPSARKLAQEKGLDYQNIIGTGPGGRITKEDIEKAVANPPKSQEKQEPAPSEDNEYRELIPYSGMRKAIGDNMAGSWSTYPMVTHHVSVDVTELLALRKTINENCEVDEKVSITDMLIKVVAHGLEKAPYMNVTFDGTNIKLLQNINIGLAVAVEKGLVVPVIRQAQGKTLLQIGKEVKDLGARARENKLAMDEMRGGTITITNLGAYGSVDWFTPIINPPESAIIGIGRIKEQPVVHEGEIKIRSMMGLSLTFDHRIIDGAPAAEFLGILIKLIEWPLRVFL